MGKILNLLMDEQLEGRLLSQEAALQRALELGQAQN
jgi:hypothetical protein